jgi:O-antigen biosynthesis protein
MTSSVELRFQQTERDGRALPESLTTRVPPDVVQRPRVRGKFLFVGDEKLYIRGVTYGTFRPDANGDEFPEPNVVERDFAHMVENGINAVRTYTVPPQWLLDAAQRYDLWVMVGLAAERYIGYLNDRTARPDIEGIIRAGVRACAGHPAVLCYAVGNEIPASIVRWFGPRRVQRYLQQLYTAVKAEDPNGLVTYVNYPSTEYLQLSFFDFVCFNVYLESQDRFEAYLARLHNVVGDRPLIMSEIGLDSLRHGEDTQARVIDWQLRASFAAGCAGAFVYAWTDEWHRGGEDVHDWAFGLTDRQRCPKPALTAAREAFSQLPFRRDIAWPRFSVIVCSYNGQRTIRECLAGVQRLEYPDFEGIVVDDGSIDATATIAREYGIRVISTENRGLSSARNTGLKAASGQIVAYLDDDASPDPHWLTYLASTFMKTEYVGVGGPNIPPDGDGVIADCVANAPGGPVHVLISDCEAEHLPGCNMAFRSAALEAVGGFDPQFRAAGDDVDICWRLQENGWKLGFNAAAVVWHHRRNSVLAYWRQQEGYGKAEALLERKWPEKYNSAGHPSWSGRLYGQGLLQSLGWSLARIYHGTWGSAPFQSVYQSTTGVLWSLPLMPEWYLVLFVLAGLSALGVFWTPLFSTLPLLLLATGLSLAQAGLGASRASFTHGPRTGLSGWGLRGLTALLHLLQPLARLSGRLRHGLTPWRRRGLPGLSLPRGGNQAVWTENWQPIDVRISLVEGALRSAGARVLRGGGYDRWDLEVRGGLLGAARLLMAVEEHGGGAQLVRVRWWPRCLPRGLIIAGALALLTAAAAIDRSAVASVILGLLAMWVSVRMSLECSIATAGIAGALERSELQRASSRRQDRPLTAQSGDQGVEQST